MDLTSLQSLLESRAEYVAKKAGAKKAIEEHRKEISQSLDEINLDLSATEKAAWLLQQYGEGQQKEVAAQIESVVTKGLQAVFQNPSLEFKLSYSETKKGDKKKVPEVSMSIWYDYNGEMVEGSLKSSFGGGLSVVAAIILRVVILLHLSHRVDSVLLLDEPLRDLSPSYGSSALADGYRERMADFLRELVEETDLQLIIVSHEPEYARVADVHHKFKGMVGKNSIVETIKQEKVKELNEYGEY